LPAADAALPLSAIDVRPPMRSAGGRTADKSAQFVEGSGLRWARTIVLGAVTPNSNVAWAYESEQLRLSQD
jgi:hypothetical protein